MSAPLSYGLWSPTINQAERGKQLRSLSALAAVYCGSSHPIVAELRAAEVDPMAFRACAGSGGSITGAHAAPAPRNIFTHHVAATAEARARTVTNWRK